MIDTRISKNLKNSMKKLLKRIYMYVKPLMTGSHKHPFMD